MDGGDNMVNVNEDMALGYNNFHGHGCLGSSESHHNSAYFDNDQTVNSRDQFDDVDDSDRTVVVEDEDDDDDYSVSNVSNDTTERTIYWESQDALLQEILEHYSSTGIKFRKEMSRLIQVAHNNEEGTTNASCKCRNPNKSAAVDGCVKCFRQRVVNLLCNQGFNASLCISRWTNTNNFPGGTHEFLKVRSSTQINKKKIVYLIELGFRDEFKMAKASDEYHALTDRLPEIFIGKTEHLNAILRIICDAAKRSTTEKKMHLGPWRKRSFMQRKWSASQEKPSKILGPVESTREEHVGFNHGFRFYAAAAVRVA